MSEKLAHFEGKLIFISGPRQAGKTFLVENKLGPNLALNMDETRDRLLFKRCPEAIINWYKTSIGPFPTSESPNKPLVFLDEIHKVKGWRNIVKATYDKTRHAINYIASGSSAFKLRGQDEGDSLAGRAIWLTLFPVSFREYIRSVDPNIELPPIWKGNSSIANSIRQNIPQQNQLRSLWNDYAKFGSFPENLVRKDEVFYKQWLEDYLSALLERDLKDLHVAKDVERVYQVFELLLEGLGSTYSLRSLAGTLGVSPNTIKNDIMTLKQVMWGFELPVAHISRTKQIRKEKKFYPMDFCLTDYREPLIDGAKFECMVASLLRRGLYSETTGILGKYHLGFYRDYEKREVDFVLQGKNKIVLAVECKLKAKLGVGNLKSLSKYKPAEMILVVEESGIFECKDDIYITSVELLAPCLE